MTQKLKNWYFKWKKDYITEIDNANENLEESL